MFYAFILGKNPTLSIAEVISVLKRERFVFVIISISAKTLVIKTDKSIENPQYFLDKLGGTIKIVDIFGKETTMGKTTEMIMGYISNNFQESKFIFGISEYGVKTGKLKFEIKKKLKEININSRIVEGKQESLSAPEIEKNKIIEKGADFIMIRAENGIFIGRTIAIQDYESYSHRDYDRPRRNAKSGMLPPKLAQIMINLLPAYNLQSTSLPIIYDPFCGNGTILQEAALMESPIMGSDISNDRIFDTEKNLEWLEKEYGTKVIMERELFQSDALKLKKNDLPSRDIAIVSEVYLGPPSTERTTEEDVFEKINILEKDYVNFLNNIDDELKNIRYLVLAIPFYVIKNKLYFLNIIDSIKEKGYNVISPFDNEAIDFSLLKEYNKKRNTILYAREDQFVGREIIILQRK